MPVIEERLFALEAEVKELTDNMQTLLEFMTGAGPHIQAQHDVLMAAKAVIQVHSACLEKLGMRVEIEQKPEVIQ